MRLMTLSLKLKMGNEKITSFGGSILLADYIKKLGLEERLDDSLPKAGNRGYKPSHKILSLISSIMLSGISFACAYKSMSFMQAKDGRYVNIDRLRKDDTVKTIWGFNNIPYSTKIGEWFLKNGKSSGDFATGKTKEVIDNISLDLAINALKEKNIKEAIFDADVSLIEANKKESKKTYKGFRGMGSLLGFVNGYCLYSDFRNGNVHASVGLLDQLKYIHQKLSDNGIKMVYRSASFTCIKGMLFQSSSYLGANGLWASVVVLAYNIMLSFKQKLNIKRLTARTIRWF